MLFSIVPMGDGKKVSRVGRELALEAAGVEAGRPYRGAGGATAAGSMGMVVEMTKWQGKRMRAWVDRLWFCF